MYVYVTGPEKKQILSTLNTPTYSYYGAYHSFYIFLYLSVSFNEQLRIFNTYDKFVLTYCLHNRSY